MCQFNFLVIAINDYKSPVDDILRKHNFNCQLLKSSDKIFISTTLEMCDCNSVFGSLQRSFRTIDLNEEKERKKLLKKKWSKAKIEKFIEQKRQSLFKSNTQLESKFLQEEQKWIELLKELQMKNIGSGIFYQNFEGEILMKHIVYKDPRNLSLNSILEGALRKIEANHIYWIDSKN